MATYSKEYVWIISANPKSLKVYSEGKARRLAEQRGVAWSRVRKKLRGVRAQIRRKGQSPLSRTFDTKGQAEVWVYQHEPAMVHGTYRDLSVAKGFTVASLLDKYALEESLSKQDKSRITLLKEHLGPIRMDELHTADCLQFVKSRRGNKKERLKKYESWLTRQVRAGNEDAGDAAELLEEARSGGFMLPPLVQDSTIHRDMDVLGSAIHWATAHCKLHISEHPLPAAKKQLVVNNQRDRRPSEKELNRLLKVSDSPLLKPFVELAIETCMRRGELCRARIEDIDWAEEMLRIPVAKSDRLRNDRKKGRTIPLTLKAVEILRSLVGKRKQGLIFGVKPDSMSQAFRRACETAGIDDLILHDLRHHGISLLFETTTLSVPEIQLITGHSRLESLKRYINLRPERVRDKLRENGK